MISNISVPSLLSKYISVLNFKLRLLDIVILMYLFDSSFKFKAEFHINFKFEFKMNSTNQIYPKTSFKFKLDFNVLLTYFEVLSDGYWFRLIYFFSLMFENHIDSDDCPFDSSGSHYRPSNSNRVSHGKYIRCDQIH